VIPPQLVSASPLSFIVLQRVTLSHPCQILSNIALLVQAEDLQAGSSYGIPGFTQQTYGSIRASDEIINEGHFIGKGQFTMSSLITEQISYHILTWIVPVKQLSAKL
jgi:hypothetical protein